MSDAKARSRGILPSLAPHARAEPAELARARSTLLDRPAPPPSPQDDEVVVRMDPTRLVTTTASLSFRPQGWLASGDPAVVWFRMPSPYHGNHGWDADLLIHGLEEGRTYVYEWSVSGKPWISPETDPWVRVRAGTGATFFAWPLDDVVTHAVVMGAFEATGQSEYVSLYPQNFREFTFYEVVVRSV